MSNDKLNQIISFWREVATGSSLYPRKITPKINFSGKEVVDLIGVRRSGKSSILKLLIEILQDKKEKNWLYINFEDPYFLNNNDPQTMESLIEASSVTLKEFPKYLFFDEVQNIKNWEAVVRKYRDAENCKIFITGSSSKLLNRELGTLLTGRHLSFESFPLSFSEFILFKGVNSYEKTDLAIKEGIFLQLFKDYLQIGGFPEVVISNNKELLKGYFQDILQRDIINRYDIRDKRTLEQMGTFLLTNNTKTISLLSLQEQFSLSFRTAALYWSYFLESFLLFELPRFSFSAKTQQKSIKKIYAVDTGLANTVSLSFSQDMGRMLENAVFLELRRAQKEMFYFKDNNGYEVDFIVKDREMVVEAIQVCWDISDKKTLERELRGLTAAKDLGFKKATILTMETMGEEKINDINVEIKPVWRWMLEN